MPTPRRPTNASKPKKKQLSYDDLVKDRALEVLGTLQGNEEEGPMMGEYIGLINDRGYNTLAN